MSSWDTNPWSNFCDPHSELICRNMTDRDLRNIHTMRNNCRDALPCMNMALKLAWYFYLLMQKPRGHYFQARSPYYQAAQCNQKTPIPICSRWQVWSEKAKKGYASTLITTALISMASSKMAGTAEYGQHISQAFYPFQEWQNSTHKGNQFILLS